MTGVDILILIASALVALAGLAALVAPRVGRALFGKRLGVRALGGLFLLGAGVGFLFYFGIFFERKSAELEALTGLEPNAVSKIAFLLADLPQGRPIKLDAPTPIAVVVDALRQSSPVLDSREPTCDVNIRTLVVFRQESKPPLYLNLCENDTEGTIYISFLKPQAEGRPVGLYRSEVLYSFVRPAANALRRKIFRPGKQGLMHEGRELFDNFERADQEPDAEPPQ